MNKMKKMLCALLAMVLVAGVCVIPSEAKSGVEQARDVENAINNATDGEQCTCPKTFCGGQVNQLRFRQVRTL